MSLDDAQLERYSRNILVNEIGANGQQKLLDTKILVIGAGGLGSPVLFYLAAAGVGTLGIVDSDDIEISNLQRQILHSGQSIGQNKTASAKQTLTALNPELTIKTYPVRLTEEIARTLFAKYNLVIDGSDNFETRFLVNRLCHDLQKPLVSGAIKGFEGMVSTYISYQDDQPCYQCFQPELPPEGALPSCTQSGVLGSIAGVIGSLMATEAMKEILGIGKNLSGRILRYQGLTGEIKTSILKRDPACPVCSQQERLRQYG